MNSTILFTDNHEEYSDLFAISGSSFLRADQTAEQTTTQFNTIHSNASSLIQLTPSHPRPSYPISSPTTPPSSIIDQSISSFDILPPALTPSTPSSRQNKPCFILSPSTQTNRIIHPAIQNDFNQTPKSACPSAKFPRTHSVDLLALRLQKTPRPSLPRSKSTTSVLQLTHHSSISTSDIHQPLKVTKSILKRPNSPSKRVRARFFSPRLSSSESSHGDSEPEPSDWVDRNGNFKAHEIIHEFQRDQPPSVHPKPFSAQKNSISKTQQPLVPLSPSKHSHSSHDRRHSHNLRFTIPEPIDLGIEPILPRRSTSPSPSPPSFPPSSYLVGTKHPRNTPVVNQVNQHASNRSTSTSLILNTSENLSNILDQSDGFLVGNETTFTSVENTHQEPSAELSIDLNHVAMIKILEKKNALSRSIATSGLKNLSKKLNPNLSSCPSVPEEDSVDVCGLAKQLEATENFPFGNPALNEEQAPANLQESLDFLSPYESSSKFNLPPLLTDEDEIWKNSIPQKKKQLETETLNSVGLPTNTDSKFLRPKTRSMTTFDHLALSKKIEGITLSDDRNLDQDTRFKIRDDLFSELMPIPPSSPGLNKSRKNESNHLDNGATTISRYLPVSSRPSTRPSATNSRLSGPIAFPSKPIGKPVSSVSSPVSRSRTSCVSTSRVPMGPRRALNIGMGLPSSSAPNIAKMANRTLNLAVTSTTPLPVNRTKLKPSNTVLKPHSTTSSPKRVMKNRSSISNQNLNMYKLQHSPPSSAALIYQNCSPTATRMAAAKTLQPSGVLNVPTTSSSTSDLRPLSISKTLRLSRLPNPTTNYQIKRNSYQ